MVEKEKIVKKPNIIWFLVDSLRPDFLSVFGNPYEPTFLDELMSKGVSFSNCITAAPFSTGSHNAMFTSFYASINKLNGYFKRVPEALDKKVVTFVDILKANGYFTAFFTPYNGRTFIPPYSFDLFEMVTSIDLFRIEKWLAASSPKLLMLGIDPIHDDSCVEREGYTKQKYRKSVVSVAEQIKYFYDKCCSPSDLIVITSDHGARVLDEPANINHSFKNESVTGVYLTDKTIKISFSFIQKDRLPSGVKINKMVRNIDIVPTVLDIVGLPLLKAQGRSLYPFISEPGQIPETEAYSETGGMISSPWRPDTWCVRTSEWKLVVKKNMERELYNLISDPYELENKIKNFPEIAEQLYLKIDRMLLNNPKTVGDYYKENGFEFKKYLRSRDYPLSIKLKVKWLRLINYELGYRLKLQVRLLGSRAKKYILGIFSGLSKGFTSIDVPAHEKKMFLMVVYRKLALPFVSLFIRWGVSPNLATTFTFLTAILTSFFIYSGWFVLAAFTWQLIVVLDQVDGMIARRTNKCSAFGAWYDFFTDRIGFFFLLVALGLTTNSSLGLWFALISFLFISLIDISSFYEKIEACSPLKTLEQTPTIYVKPIWRRTLAWLATNFIFINSHVWGMVGFFLFFGRPGITIVMPLFLFILFLNAAFGVWQRIKIRRSSS